MIVMNREQNQSVVIGGDIIVTVLEVVGDEVRLGIEYPDERGYADREVFATVGSAEAEEW